jgi:AbrB family looped-hinge helix DNA binding protein
MPTSTLTSKGQITLPQAVRTALGLEAGDKLDFVGLSESNPGFIGLVVLVETTWVRWVMVLMVRPLHL